MEYTKSNKYDNLLVRNMRANIRLEEPADYRKVEVQYGCLAGGGTSLYYLCCSNK
jgi:hypothetical protein